MPLYDYVCGSCELKFEEVVSSEGPKEIKCPNCSEIAERQFPDSISVKTTLDSKRDTIYSPKEIDKVVGADAEKKWERIEQSRKNRIGNLKLKEMDLPKGDDGKYSPVMHLGSPEDRKLRKDITDIMGEHIEERKAKGVPQFEGEGSFE